MSKEILETAESSELSLYTINDSTIYHQAIQPVIRCLAKKIKAGNFDEAKARKAFYNVATFAAKRYANDFGGCYYKMFSTEDRRLTAAYLTGYFMEDIRETAEA